MPVYKYRCGFCNVTWEEYHSVDHRNINCGNCKMAAEILISPTASPVVYEYYDDGLGEQVTGPGHRKRLMKEKSAEEL